jgi:hypothetical protein
VLISVFALGTVSLGAKVITNTIGGTAALTGHGHVARATVLVGCTEGEQVQLTLTLTQGGVSGTGAAAGVCTGELTEYDVTVPAAGDSFTAGLAAACATADNYRHGVLAESRQWCRAGGVVLVD